MEATQANLLNSNNFTQYAANKSRRQAIAISPMPKEWCVGADASVQPELGWHGYTVNNYSQAHQPNSALIRIRPLALNIC